MENEIEFWKRLININMNCYSANMNDLKYI